MSKTSITVSAISLLLCALFAWFTAIIVNNEVLPALKTGTLNIDTSSMILNRTWDGNEIYIIIGLYAACSLFFGHLAFRLIKRS